jgi:hypothetical protein
LVLSVVGCGFDDVERVESTRQGFVNAVPTLLVPSIDLTGRSFGAAIVTDGESALVTANADTSDNDGSVILFTRAVDVWAESHVFDPPESNSLYGTGLALRGDTLAIGGAGVWIHRGPDWQLEAALEGEFLHTSFGDALALDENLLAVGDAEAITDDSAYVFERSGSTWTEVAHVFPSDTTEDREFGAAVAIAGDVLVVGAPGPVVAGLGGPLGAVYVYRRQGGSWTETQKLLSSDAVDGDRFGEALAMSNGILVVGAWRSSVELGETGKVFVFEDVGGTFQEKVAFGSPTNNISFGLAVSFDGTTLLAGGGGFDESGKAELFDYDGGAFTPSLILSDLELPAGSYFGTTVGISGDIAVVGAQEADAAYAFNLFDAKKCTPDGTGVIESTGATTSCAPYLCAEGACATACVTSNDCVVGSVCDTALGQGQCVPESRGVAAADEGGCETRVLRSERSSGAVALAVLALAWLRRRARISA